MMPHSYRLCRERGSINIYGSYESLETKISSRVSAVRVLETMPRFYNVQNFVDFLHNISPQKGSFDLDLPARLEPSTEFS